MLPTDKPELGIVEVTVIGTGGGYGESVVIHLGTGKWVLIDSCIDPYTKQPLAVSYFNSIGVDISNDLELIICTHWHDDHIQGISEILKVAVSSKLVLARTTDIKKFLQFVGLDHEKVLHEASNTSTKEYKACLEILKSRNSKPIFCQENTKIYNDILNDISLEIYSLSPSNLAQEKFDIEISRLIKDYGNRHKRARANSPNLKSVVTFFKIGKIRFLLGADMEVSNEAYDGWNNILNNNLVIDSKASLFKVPHHGSETGYHERIWLELLDSNPLSAITPWNKNKTLPQQNMIDTFRRHTDLIFITSNDYNLKGAKKRTKAVSKMLRDMKYEVKEIRYMLGLIRNRVDLGSNNHSHLWTTDLFQSARKL